MVFELEYEDLHRIKQRYYGTMTRNKKAAGGWVGRVISLGMFICKGPVEGKATHTELNMPVQLECTERKGKWGKQDEAMQGLTGPLRMGVSIFRGRSWTKRVTSNSRNTLPFHLSFPSVNADQSPTSLPHVMYYLECWGYKHEENIISVLMKLRFRRGGRF